MSSSITLDRSRGAAMEEEEEAELHKIFTKFDNNGDGKISIVELRSVLSELGWEMTPEEEQNAMSEFDKDGDGHIDLEEFKAVMAKGKNDDEALRDAFDLYDLDKNGFISAAELRLMLGRLGFKHSIGQCHDMIAVYDTNGDGSIDFEEFRKMMMNRS